LALSKRRTTKEKKKRMQKKYDFVLGELKRCGVLLMTDNRLPNVVSIIIEEPIKGSWWGHPKGKEVFHILERLDDSEEATTAKLVAHKVTFIHKDLWPALAGVGASGEAWQMEHLSDVAKDLLKRVEHDSILETNDKEIHAMLKASPKACEELEKALVIHTEQFHSKSGAHYKRLRSWSRWAKDHKLKPLKPAEAKAKFQETVNEIYPHDTKLPWHSEKK
jgi:hypothetical protein